MPNENEMAKQNYAKAMAKVDELCHKVVEDPRHYSACVIDDGCTYILPVSKILAIAEDAHKRELAAKDAEIAEQQECLQEAVEWSCGNPDESCGDCVAHGGDTPCKCEKWRKALKKAREVVK